ncbi:MAG: sigma-70 family RNA polymerase sigma factor [Acidimicrobiia bacterium]|nr:sigma-70 family RNA polymerase sigma factor [Acidimicrobiia bacterium]
MGTGVRDARRDLTVDANLVEDARQGDDLAFGRLYDAWFDRAYDHAFHILRNPDTAAEIAQDSFLTAWRRLDELRDGAAFGGWVLQIARNRALNRLRVLKRTQPVDAAGMALIEATAKSPRTAPAGFAIEDRVGTVDDPEVAAEDGELVDLVWDAATGLSERDAVVLDLHLRHGYEPADIATQMGVTRNNANQMLHRVRARLGDAIRARVLWRHGEPLCHDLARALREGDVGEFGPEAVKAITAHAAACEECSERQQTRLAPSALFSLVPAVAIPFLLKAKAAAALESAGVPLQGSASVTGKSTVTGGSGGDSGEAGAGGRGGGRHARLEPASGSSLTARLTVVAGVAAVAILGVVSFLILRDNTSAPSSLVTTDPSPVVTVPPPAQVPTTEPVETEDSEGAEAGGTSGPPRTTGSATPAPPPEIEYVRIRPGKVSTPYAMESYTDVDTGKVAANPPVLSWSVSDGEGSVEVTGAGVSSGSFSGSEALCPGSLDAPLCYTTPGWYAVTVTVYDADGEPVDSAEASFYVS